MTARDLFWDATGTVRPPWRLAIFGASTVASLVLVNATVRWLARGALEPLGAEGIALPWVLLASVVLGHLVTFRLVEPRGWRSVRLDRSALRPTGLAGAAVLSGGAILAATAPLLAAGWLRIDSAPAGSSIVAGLTMLVVLAPAALWEEMIFRGYAFAVLAEWWGTPAALGASAVLFGLVHLQNVGATPESIAVVVLAGIFLGAVVVVTRSLWAAFAAHLAWNWTLAGLLHDAVSGIPFSTPDYRLVDTGPDWATGGSWGIEGGVPAGLALVGATIYLYLRRNRREES